MNSQIHDEDRAPDETTDVQKATEAQKDGAAQPTADASPKPEQQGQSVTQSMVDAANAQAQEYLEGWQRARAEFANYKKRVEREIKDSHSNAAGSVLKDILPVIDDYERAINNIPENLKNDPWVGGVSMILRKLYKVLDDYEVIIIEPTGELFDPHRHEAIGMEDSDSVESGHVTATMQKGYILGDRVLRPALVRVAN